MNPFLLQRSIYLCRNLPPENPEPWQYHIFTQGAGGRALTQSETLRKVVIIMSTYEEFSLIISVALLIVTILNYTHKK